MGVYISGLEIPPKGKGAVVILCSSGAVYSGGQKVGTAVPVPPHGDLIDRDAYAYPGDLVDEPVIIPAEEGE